MPNSTCAVVDCDRPRKGTYCHAHGERNRRWGDPRADIPIGSRGASLKGLFCSADGCGLPAYCRFSDGLVRCQSHHRYFGKYGTNEPPVRPIPVRYNNRGYLVQRVNGRDILQHRHIMEGILGRALLPNENVHHINGVRDDNRVENLEVWSSSQPAGQRIEDKVLWAREILALYAP